MTVCWTTWAGRVLVVAALVVLTPVTARANICHDNTPGSSGTAYDRILPFWDFTKSYQLYQSGQSKEAREALQTELRYFVAYNVQIIHQRHLEYARAQAFDPNFIALYEDAIAWGRALCEPGGERAYAEHLTYMAQPDETSQQLAGSLKNLAASLEHPQSSFEYAVAEIDDRRGWVRRGAVGTLHTLSARDYVPAQVVLAELYERGRVASMDRARAFYWYIRAQRGGADVRGRLAALTATLQPGERARADAWLSSGETPWVR